MNRRRLVDPVLSMINVVFLLIAFFLFGELRPEPPLAVTLPRAELAGEQDFEIQFLVDETGALMVLDARNRYTPFIRELTQINGKRSVVRVDARTDANLLIARLADLAARGLSPAIEVQP